MVATDWTSIPSVEALAKEQERTLGSTDVRLADTLSALADLHFVAEDYAAAELVYYRVLSIRQKSLGDAHPDTATTLRNLAELYEIQDRYAEAERFYRWSVSAQKQAMLKKHSDGLERTQTMASSEVQSVLPSADALQHSKCSVCGRQLLDSLVCLYCTQSDFDAASILKAAQEAQDKRTPGPVNLLVHRNGHKFKLDDREITIGRHPSNQIVLSEDKHISRHHAVIKFKAGDFYIADTGTVNGTYVNAHKIASDTKLQRGDLITMGGITLTADYGSDS